MILLRSGFVLLIIFFAPLAIRKVNGVVLDSFRLTGWTGQSPIQAEARGGQAQGDPRLICQKWHLWVQNTADLASKNRGHFKLTRDFPR